MFLKILFFASTLFAASPGDFLWKNRVIVVEEASLIKKQLEAFKEDKKGYEERKLIILHFPMFHKNKDICCALLGLDGGVKATSKAPFSKKVIFDLIDSMPMRQAELRKKANPEKKN